MSCECQTEYLALPCTSAKHQVKVKATSRKCLQVYPSTIHHYTTLKFHSSFISTENNAMAVLVFSFHRLISGEERWHSLSFIATVKTSFYQENLDYFGARFMWSITSFVSVKRMNGKQCLVPLGEITNMRLCRLA